MGRVKNNLVERARERAMYLREHDSVPEDDHRITPDLLEKLADRVETLEDVLLTSPHALLSDYSKEIVIEWAADGLRMSISITPTGEVIWASCLISEEGVCFSDSAQLEVLV